MFAMETKMGKAALRLWSGLMLFETQATSSVLYV